MNDQKRELLEKWPAEKSGGDRVAAFAARFPSIEKLHEFYEDTRKLSWPETYGASPWEFASTIAHLAFSNQAEVPDHFHEPWRSDLVRAIEGLENRYVLEGERASVFKWKLFRVLARGMQTEPTRHEVFEMTSPFYFKGIHFVAVLEPKEGNPLLGNVVLYRGNEYPCRQPPIATYAVRDVIKRPRADVDLTELGRIFRFGNGKDGYQWGDTRGDEGGYCAETLACLTLLGYARRTGADVRNQLGGSWPEVEVTPKGIQALLQSNILRQTQQDMEAHGMSLPTASVASGFWGDFEFCVRTGAVLGVGLDGSAVAEDRINDMPVRIDVAELAKAYPDETIANQTYDILDVGYWTADGRYEVPEEDFREELRLCHAAP